MSVESTAGGRVEPAPAPGEPPSRRADQIEDARRQRRWRIKVALVWVGDLHRPGRRCFHLVKFDTDVDAPQLEVHLHGHLGARS